jgi:RNA methyltransferase, TrmH family
MAAPETITSPANPLLKEIRKAIAHGGRTEDGCSVAETFHLLEEAVRSKREIVAVLVTEQAWPAMEPLARTMRGSRTIVLPDRLFGGIAATETSQGVMALIRLPEWDAGELLRGDAPVVVLDGIQDPGNAGTIVRAAEAFGAGGVIFVKGTVSPYNPKTLRASAGSLFRIPFIEGLEAEAARVFLAGRGVPVYAATASGGLSLHEVDLTRRCAIVIGSEGRGVGETLQTGATGLRIPTVEVESLNAAVAASVILYEAKRQKMVLA